jgi:hypothetical protein
MITDVMRNSNSEREVFFLLSTYIDAVRFGDRFQLLPESVTTLPLNQSDEVRARLGRLLHELDAASRNLDDHYCEVLREAVHVFGTALELLIKLERRQHALQAA